LIGVQRGIQATESAANSNDHSDRLPSLQTVTILTTSQLFSRPFSDSVPKLDLNQRGSDRIHQKSVQMVRTSLSTCLSKCAAHFSFHFLWNCVSSASNTNKAQHVFKAALVLARSRLTFAMICLNKHDSQHSKLIVISVIYPLHSTSQSVARIFS
jgi:hypothetical protein